MTSVQGAHAHTRQAARDTNCPARLDQATSEAVSAVNQRIALRKKAVQVCSTRDATVWSLPEQVLVAGRPAVLLRNVKLEGMPR